MDGFLHDDGAWSGADGCAAAALSAAIGERSDKEPAEYIVSEILRPLSQCDHLQSHEHDSDLCLVCFGLVAKSRTLKAR